MSDYSPFKVTYPEEVYSISAAVTVVLDVAWNELGAADVLLLNKILQSIGHSLDSVRVVRQDPFDLSDWIDRPSRIIVFGAGAKGVPLYEVMLSGDVSIVFADALKNLGADDAAKRKLWTTLKSLFRA